METAWMLGFRWPVCQSVSQEIRGHLLSHGVTGVQVASYDGHDYAPQKLEALDTLQRFLAVTRASVVLIASRVAA